jgi:hypothetical protein
MVLSDAVADLQDRVREWAREHVKAASVEEAEQLSLEIGRVVAQTVAEESIRQTAGKATYEGSSRDCECGRRAKFVGYRERDLGTLCGLVRVRRAYYHCRHCSTGALPWDEAQGLTNRLWTPGVKALVAELSARLPYAEATELLGRLSSVRLEESSAEEIVSEVGDRVRRAEEERTRAVLEGRVAPGCEASRDRLYVEMDGSHAHIDGSWHEVKSGVIFEAERGDNGIDTSGVKHYVSAREPAERFGERLYEAAVECGLGGARETVVVGDGAEWIWNLADHHYPGATQIVDYWHACGHIHDLAKSLYEEGSAQGKHWAEERCRSLRTRGPTSLLRALRRRHARTPEQAEAIRAALRYFGNHSHRMRYPEFRRRGLMIGSGPVEAACKVVVGHRMKRAGMQWSHEGADHVLAVRCLVLNRQYDELRWHARAAA